MKELTQKAIDRELNYWALAAVITKALFLFLFLNSCTISRTIDTKNGNKVKETFLRKEFKAYNRNTESGVLDTIRPIKITIYPKRNK